MTPQCFLTHIVDPALSLLEEVTGIKADDHTRIMLVAIALQETHLSARAQMSGGPARGWFQFEIVGVRGVMQANASRDKLLKMLDVLVIPHDAQTVWEAITYSDHLAVALARLNLWCDPHPMPGNRDDGWETYLRVWRPGRPRLADWSANWNQAAIVVAGTPGTP